jgi:glycosyltransferase involved in cell wall biosynthesis
MATIGLSMIVKNEAKLILRCLESVLPLVDYVGISDTGSTDGTQKIILDYLDKKDFGGQVSSAKWVNFSHNRNKALELLDPIDTGLDYVFVIDADDTLEIAPNFDIAAFKAAMNFDIYDLMVEHGGVIHPRPQIFRNKPGYQWVGVLHEYVEAPDGFSRATEPGLKIHATIEGSRNADPKKFQKDAEILKKALKTEKNGYLRNRYTFYLAQSYRDAEDPENALKCYLKRASMGGWDQEVYVSYVEAIRCFGRIEKSGSLDAPRLWYDSAVAHIPKRAEAHHAFSFLCRQFGNNDWGTQVARMGLEMAPAIPDGLFIQPWIYDYGLRDEFAVNAYWAGHYLESLRANLQLLSSEKTPHNMVKRLADNSIACLDKLKLVPIATIPETPFVFSD